MSRGRDKRASLLFVPFRELFQTSWDWERSQSAVIQLNVALVEKARDWQASGWSVYGYMNETTHLDNPDANFAAVVQRLQRHHQVIKNRYESLIEGVQVCFHTRKEKCLCRPPQPGLIHNAVYNHSRRWGGEGLISRKDVVVVGNRNMANRADVGSIYLLTEFLKADPEQSLKGAT